MSKRILALLALVALLAFAAGCAVSPQPASAPPSGLAPRPGSGPQERLASPSATNTILGCSVIDISHGTASVSLVCRNLTATMMSFTPKQAICLVTATAVNSQKPSREATFSPRWQLDAAAGATTSTTSSGVQAVRAGPLIVPPSDALQGLVDFGPLAPGDYLVSAKMLNIPGVESPASTALVR